MVYCLAALKVQRTPEFFATAPQQTLARINRGTVAECQYRMTC
jgi:hypothetical protein